MKLKRRGDRLLPALRPEQFRPRGAAAPGQALAAARLTPYLLGGAWVAVLAVLALYLLSPDAARSYALYPLLVGMVVLGLPHGALDHLVPARLGLAWARRPLLLALYLLGYAALAALYFGLWTLAPRLAFAGFLLTTVVHWGQGDLRFLEIFLGRLRPTLWGAWVTLLVRGALPVTLPVLAFPETAESLYRHAALGLGLGITTLDLSTPWLVGSLLSLLGVALAAYLVNAVRAAPRRSVLALDLLELGLLAALFTVVPAYLAIGVYFALWHSLRHLARLLLLEHTVFDHTVLAPHVRRAGGGDLVSASARLSVELLPVTLIALGLLGSIYLLNAPRVVTLEGFVALYLVLISALTVPHAVVVALMDVWGASDP